MIRVLSTLKPGYQNNKTIFGFDVETFHVDKGDYVEQKFLMGSVVREDDKKIFWDKDDMRDYIASKKFRNSTLFATNLDFDFKHVFQGSKFYDACKKVNRHGSLIFARFKENNNYIDFLDTMNYAPLSVEKIAKVIGMNKLDHPVCFGRKPKNDFEKKQMEDYNINDSLITQRFACHIQDFFNHLGCKMKNTNASTGNDFWRRYGQPHDLFQEKEEWLIKHYEGSLRGGRTECLKRGYCTDVYYYDYNSHYPARCFYGVDEKGNYPDPSTAHYTKKADEDLINEYEGITKVKLRCLNDYFPLIGFRTKKLIFPNGDFSSWLTNIEIRHALKNGYEVLEYGESLYYTENFIPFRKPVKMLYDMRKKFKEDNNECFSTMCKNIMNSGLFGKFAQKLDGYEDEVSLDKIKCDDNGVLYIDDGEKIFYPEKIHVRGSSAYVLRGGERKIPLFIFPILSSYTTALGRIKLWNDAHKHADVLRYLDTDSMALDKKCMGDSKELGELKLETTLSEAIFVKPKFYYANDGNKEWVKCKGVGKNLKNKNDFDHLFDTGEVETMRFAKSKEAGVRKIPFSSILKVCKHISFEDDKRRWAGSFNPLRDEDSSPLFLYNGV